MTTGLITATTEGQEVQFDRVIQDTIREARKVVPMDKDAMQRLLGNGGKFQDDVIASLIRHSVADERFGLLTSFELTVPKGYNHGTQLATFAKFTKEKSERFYFYNENITDANYAKATRKLVPCKAYGVKIFGIKQRVTSEDCLAFLASQRAILVGAQGVSLTRQLKKEKFPVGKWTVSFDEKDALSSVGGSLRVPFVRRNSVGDWRFSLGVFEGDWGDAHCLLCFCDLPAGRQA